MQEVPFYPIYLMVTDHLLTIGYSITMKDTTLSALIAGELLNPPMC